MNVFHTDTFEIPLPPDHRFPLAKYRLLRERVVALGIVPASALAIAPRASTVDLERVHTPGYVSRVVLGTLSDQEQRRIGLPWSPGLAERALRSVGATIAAARAAVAHGTGIYLGGGTHHAFPDFGAGFCVFNDVPVAIRALQADELIRRVVVIDADVHQGDGTAAIFSEDESVFTFSIHGENNFPARKQRSDLDVALPDGTGDERYLETFRGALATALERSRPDFLCYLAGADPFAGDRLGKLALTREGLVLRDRLVREACERLGLPVAVVMAGGYASPIESTVEIQAETVRVFAQTAALSSASGVR